MLKNGFGLDGQRLARLADGDHNPYKHAWTKQTLRIVDPGNQRYCVCVGLNFPSEVANLGGKLAIV
jgi:hypothetical protein